MVPLAYHDIPASSVLYHLAHMCQRSRCIQPLRHLKEIELRIIVRVLVKPGYLSFLQSLRSIDISWELVARPGLFDRSYAGWAGANVG